MATTAVENGIAPPQTLDDWDRLITTAINTPDPLLSNFRITRAHYLLSTAMIAALGPQSGANFHSWAVWGSRKAGITIRQEDKDVASRDATVVAGLVGLAVGLAVGYALNRFPALAWAGWVYVWPWIGLLVGGYCGYLLAGYTRRAAAQSILAGNRTVLDDVGRLTARYLSYVQNFNDSDVAGREEAFTSFRATFRDGPTQHGGQELLRRAFEQYETARRSNDLKVQHESTYFANCLAVLHEHIRLQPYVARSLPFLIRKCVTQRLMTYSVGQRTLAVHDDVPPLGDATFPATLATLDNRMLQEFLTGPAGWDTGRGTLYNTRARDWTHLDQRMGYIVNLFRTAHLDVNTVASPYSSVQLAAIARGDLPDRPW